MNLIVVLCHSFLIHSYIGLVYNSICTVSAFENNCFRAAVYEHVQQTDNNYKDIHHLIELNLKVYENVAKEAAFHDVDIIVFPEDGILFNLSNRKGVRPFLEEIPNPFNSSFHNPCKQSDEYKNTHPIQSRLSCMARDNNIYVVADMGDIQQCSGELNCPSDGFYQFNTAVVFDNSGNLVAKYHKMHLFGEIYYDLPPKPEFVTIDTPFGRIGVQICFDIIFNTPGVYLAEHLNVETILFPTWWFDELPFLSAAQFQQSWALTNKVNLLAANIQMPELGSLGSGIYSGESGAVIYTNKPDGNSKLLIADIPISAKSEAKCQANTKLIHFDSFANNSQPKKYTFLDMSLKNTEQYLLTKSSDTIVKCHNGLCCQLIYSLGDSGFENNETYYLIISNRTRDGSHQWAEEFCALIRCKSNQNDKCLTFTNSMSKTTFDSIELKANFSTKYIYPSVMTNDNELINTKEWHFSIKEPQTELIVQKFNKPLITYGFYARSYTRDPPFKQIDNGIL